MNKKEKKKNPKNIKSSFFSKCLLRHGILRVCVLFCVYNIFTLNISSIYILKLCLRPFRCRLVNVFYCLMYFVHLEN